MSFNLNDATKKVANTDKDAAEQRDTEEAKKAKAKVAVEKFYKQEHDAWNKFQTCLEATKSGKRAANAIIKYVEIFRDAGVDLRVSLQAVALIMKQVEEFHNAAEFLTAESLLNIYRYGHAALVLKSAIESDVEATVEGLRNMVEAGVDWEIVARCRNMVGFDCARHPERETRELYEPSDWNILNLCLCPVDREEIRVAKILAEAERKATEAENRKTSEPPIKNEVISPADKARDVLSGNSLRIFNELANRKHFVKFDTLKDTAWKENPDITDAAIVKAIKRMRETLDGKNIPFDITIQKSEGRVKLVEMHINQEDK